MNRFKYRAPIAIIMALLLCSCFVGASDAAMRMYTGGGNLTPQQVKKLDTFFSNFAEAYLPYFGFDNPPLDLLINFGVAHVALNNRSVCKFGEGEYTAYVPAPKVRDAVRKYFGKNITVRGTSICPMKQGYLFYDSERTFPFRFAQLTDFKSAGSGMYKATFLIYDVGNGYGFNGDAHASRSEWQRTIPNEIPAKVAICEALVSRSPSDPGRYILRAYQKAGNL